MCHVTISKGERRKDWTNAGPPEAHQTAVKLIVKHLLSIEKPAGWSKPGNGMNAYKDNNNGNVKKWGIRNRKQKEGIHQRKIVKYYVSLKQRSGDVWHDMFLNVKQSCAD